MNPTVVIAASVVFVLGVVAYVLFMVFLPEWVGITGKKALEAQRAHRGDAQDTGPDVLDRMHVEDQHKDKNKGENKP